MKGETPEPDVQVFKEVLPEILKWIQNADEKEPNNNNPKKPSKKKARPNFDML